MVKQTYIIEFENYKMADYWLRQFRDKFKEDLILYDRIHQFVEFPESIYYFRSINSRDKHYPHDAIVYDQDAAFIILDDIERFRFEDGSLYTPEDSITE